MVVPFRFPCVIRVCLKSASAGCQNNCGWRCRIAALFLAMLGSIGLAPQSQAQQGHFNPVKPLAAQKPKKSPPFTAQDRLRYYEKTTFSPLALTGPVLGAAFTEWTTRNPPEWGQGVPGLGRRVLSGYTRQLISNTIILGVGFADHEDPRHYRTGQQGFWKRGLYAAREVVVSRNAGTGELMPAYSRIIGDYAAGFVSNTWYPAQFSNVHDALWRGSTALASDIIWQELKEFWPDVHRKLRLRR